MDGDVRSRKRLMFRLELDSERDQVRELSAEHVMRATWSEWDREAFEESVRWMWNF